MRARTGLWEPRAGNDPGPPGHPTTPWVGSEAWPFSREQVATTFRTPRLRPSRRETAAELLMSLTNLILQPLQDWQSIAAYTVARAAAQAIPSVSVAPAASAPSLPG